MKRIFGLVAALLGLWAAHTVSPYVAIASLGRAIERGDRAFVVRRLDIASIRASLTHHLLNAYWNASEGAAALVNPLVIDYVTEDSILDSWSAGRRQRPMPASLKARSWPRPGRWCATPSSAASPRWPSACRPMRPDASNTASCFA